jgi:hypothetical protein
MKTYTHYIDNGQHELPECMQNTTIRRYTTIVDGDTYEEMDAREADAIRDACRALGIETEIDDEGALCATRVREDDLLEAFRADDRYCVLTDSDLELHGGGDRCAAKAAAWLLDPANSTAFEAVLDPDDMTVGTLDDEGDVAWVALADFVG